MGEYKTVNIEEEMHSEIKKIVEEENYFYRSISEFIHSTLRDKILELRKLRYMENLQSSKNDDMRG